MAGIRLAYSWSTTPTGRVFTTPIPRATSEEALRDARAWIWVHHPESDFGSFDQLT